MELPEKVKNITSWESGFTRLGLFFVTRKHG